jgi:hypothetical protein
MRGIPVKRSSPFSEACTAFLRIMPRIVALFPPRCHALGSQFIATPARYEFADPLTLHFRSPDTQVPPQWP